MRALVLAAALLGACAALAADEPGKPEPPKLGHNEAACDKVRKLCIVNLDDLVDLQRTIEAAAARIKALELELAAEKAKKEKRCAVVTPQRYTER